MVSTKVPQTVLFLGCKNTLLNPECLISVFGIINHLYFLHKPQMVPYSTLRSRKHLKLLLVSFTKSPLKHGITTFFSHHLTRSLTTQYIKSSGNLFIAFWFLSLVFHFTSVQYAFLPHWSCGKGLQFPKHWSHHIDCLGNIASRSPLILQYNKRQRDGWAEKEMGWRKLRNFATK